MKRGVGMVVVLAAVATAGVARAGEAWSSLLDLRPGTVVVSNGQANSSWVPVAVLWSFDPATNGTVAVVRHSQGARFVLGARSVTNATSAIWIPEAGYPFAVGDALLVTSTATNGQVQVIRKGG